MKAYVNHLTKLVHDNLQVVFLASNAGGVFLQIDSIISLMFYDTIQYMSAVPSKI